MHARFSVNTKSNKVAIDYFMPISSIASFMNNRFRGIRSESETLENSDLYQTSR